MLRPFRRYFHSFLPTVLYPQAEIVDLVFVGFVYRSDLVTEVFFGDFGAVGVEDVAGE